MNASQPQGTSQGERFQTPGGAGRGATALRWLASVGKAVLLSPAAEVLLIGLWAAWVGRELMDFNPFTWPIGREFGYQIEGHLFWAQLRECGLCALWNGGVNGGYPALADLFSSKFHPLVFIPTLLWGSIVGVKVTIVLSLWMAGAAQWWLARTLRLGRIARLWGAFLVIVGGHLWGRLELGSPGLMLSTAASCLALAAAIELAVTGKRKSAIGFGITTALAIVSGVGYLQLGLLVWMPALLILLIEPGRGIRPAWKEFVLAGGIALLLTAVVLLPTIHIYPHYDKFTSPEFEASQPVEFIPLNLVISDHDFMRSGLLGKLPFEYLYHLYIGWLPIILAVSCLRLAERRDARLLLTLACGTLLTFIFAAAIPMRFMVKFFPELSGFRHTPLIAGMAVPGIVALAAYGLDRVLKMSWPRIALLPQRDAAKPAWTISLAWLMAIPLIWSVRSAYRLSQDFSDTNDVASLYQAVGDLRTTEPMWVATPFGEHYWVEPSIAAGLKLTNVVAVWRWKGREMPLPSLVAQREAVPEGAEVVGFLQGSIPIVRTGQSYAYVRVGNEIVPCRPSGRGGDITVECSTEAAGQLVVEENAWSGWKVSVDGAGAGLLPGPWLSTEAPPGVHTFHFVYRPWDVPVGIWLSVLGVLLCVALWWMSRGERAAEPSAAAAESDVAPTVEARPAPTPEVTRAIEVVPAPKPEAPRAEETGPAESPPAPPPDGASPAPTPREQ